MKSKTKENLSRFENLTYDDFRKMAKDPSLSDHEKIGFPNSYREEKEQFIFDDILSKIPALGGENKTVLDIGPGCGPLARIIIQFCKEHNHQLVLVDSSEMLALIDNEDFIKKIDAYYPDIPELFSDYSGKFDVILTYSVLHYIFVESNLWRFVDKSLELLASGGSMLIGDIPNFSKRKRFFSSDTGKQFHRNFTGQDEDPELHYNQLESENMDDSVIFAIAQRVRLQGFDSYILPQSKDLPMANRREDILISRP